MRYCLLALLWIFAPAFAAGESAVPSPHAIEVPKWFTESFLDFREDIRDAARERKRLLVYFGQDGCPYCKALMKVNFGEKDIVEKTRANFVPVALNLWGDREVTWIDGRVMSEKELARALKVQYTPTLIFFDEQGGTALRLNGYLPPEKFRIALDYAAGRMEKKLSYAEYAAQRERAGTTGALIAEPFFQASSDLARLSRAGKPTAAFFEQKDCSACAELHRDAFTRPEVKRLLERFSVVQLDLAGNRALVSPDARPTNEREWARELGIAHAPSVVFFDTQGSEVFRVEGYVRPFHLASALDYVASGAYRGEPSFQRFIQKRGEALRAKGQAVDLWK